MGEVRLGDEEVLERSVELDGVGRSPEVNEEEGREEFVSTTRFAVVGGKRMGKQSSQT